MRRASSVNIRRQYWSWTSTRRKPARCLTATRPLVHCYWLHPSLLLSVVTDFRHFTHCLIPLAVRKEVTMSNNLPSEWNNSDISRQCFKLGLKTWLLYRAYSQWAPLRTLFKGHFANLQIDWLIDWLIEVLKLSRFFCQHFLSLRCLKTSALVSGTTSLTICWDRWQWKKDEMMSVERGGDRENDTDERRWSLFQ